LPLRFITEEVKSTQRNRLTEDNLMSVIRLTTTGITPHLKRLAPAVSAQWLRFK
jgi:hypothetical protein